MSFTLELTSSLKAPLATFSGEKKAQGPGGNFVVFIDIMGGNETRIHVVSGIVMQRKKFLRGILIISNFHDSWQF